MADDLTKEQRHKNMKNIHGKDTKIEVILRKALWNKGYRYRKNYKKLPGSPDIVLTKYKIAIFCDGEFFHGKDWDTLKKRLEKRLDTQDVCQTLNICPRTVQTLRDKGNLAYTKKSHKNRSLALTN